MIKEKKEILDEQIKELEKKYDKKDLVSILGTTFFTSLGIMVAITMPFLGFSLISAGAGLFAANRGIAKRKKAKEARLKQEKQHLEKIEKEGLKVSAETNKKRVKKVAELSEAKKGKEKARKTLSIANNIALLGMGATAVASVMFPVIGLAGCALCAAGKIITESALTKKTKEVEKLDNRLENLCNDMEVITAAKKQSAKNGTQQKKTEPKKPIQQKKQPQQVKKPNPVSSASPKFDKNEDIAQQYINMMAQNKYCSDTPYQKVKY